MKQIMAGGCQCGSVRYQVQIDNHEAYLCHCRMCQRATGGVSIAFKNVAKSNVEWTTRVPDRFASSPIAVRGFCSTCGTPLTYEGISSENLDLTVGSFDEPERFHPVSHAGAESRHDAWLDTSGLPSQRTDENAGIVRKWLEATGRGPD